MFFFFFVDCVVIFDWIELSVLTWLMLQTVIAGKYISLRGVVVDSILVMICDAMYCQNYINGNRFQISLTVGMTINFNLY